MIPMTYDKYFPTYDELNYDAEVQEPLNVEPELVALPPVIIHLIKAPFSNTIEYSSFYEGDYRHR